MTLPDSNVVLGVASLVVATVLTYATIRYANAAKRQANAADKQAAATDRQAIISDNQATIAERQVQATERQTEALASRPYVFLRIETVGAAVMLVNGGDRVAHDVRLTIEHDSTPIGASGTLLSGSMLASAPSPAIPPGGVVRESRDISLLGSATRTDTTRFTIEYRDAEGREFSESSTYSLGEANWLGGPPLVGVTSTEREEAWRHGEVVKAIQGVEVAIKDVTKIRP